jgi:outer membrane protein, heavy metal efflux system
MKKLFLTLALAIISGAVIAQAAGKQPGAERERIEGLTLEQALDMAERQQPELAEASAMVEAAAARARQAGLFPNPEAIAGAQQMPFSSAAPNEREYVAGVAQAIPLSGRLSKAREAELMDRQVRARGLELKRREIRKRVHSAFAMALYQEKAMETESRIVKHAEKAVAISRVRLEAGDALPEDVARAEMEMARAKVGLARSTALRERSLAALTAAIGDPGLPVISLAGALDTVFEIPALESLAAGLSAHPAIALAEADIDAKNARIALARAERIPDLKVEALYHRLEASKQNTMDVGLRISVPLFDRNQGRLREARAEVAAAEARSRATQNELNLRLRQAYIQLTTSLANSRALQTEILSRADSVLNAAEARYAAGDISLSDLLPIRRDWAGVQLDYLESLRDVMQAWAELSGYLGSP